MDDSGNLFYDYTNHRVGKMLVDETKSEMEADVLDIWWEDPEETNNPEEKDY